MSSADSTNSAIPPRLEDHERTRPGNDPGSSGTQNGSTMSSGIEMTDLECDSTQPVDQTFREYLGRPPPDSAIPQNVQLGDAQPVIAQPNNAQPNSVRPDTMQPNSVRSIDLEEALPDLESEQSLNYNRSVFVATYNTYATHTNVRFAVDDHPNGYPRLAAFMNCDPNFLVCRKFGFLHNRVLLYRQDELRELEEELLSMDRMADEFDLKSRTREEISSSARRDLLNKIDQKLKQYDDIVERTRSFAALQQTTRRNHDSIRNWFDYCAPLVQAEASTFYRAHDLVSIVNAKEDDWFESQIESTLSRFGGFMGTVSDTSSNYNI
jgi:hypothetical protein